MDSYYRSGIYRYWGGNSARDNYTYGVLLVLGSPTYCAQIILNQLGTTDGIKLKFRGNTLSDGTGTWTNWIQIN